MSALEQIRKRPALIISILGLALLLFILTAISNPEKLFSDPTTIAKVDGEKIDYTQFQNRHHMLMEQDEQRARANGQTSKTDGALLEMQTMNSIIDEVLLTKKLEKLGITVTDAEITELISGAQPHPLVAQYVQGLGFPSAVEFYNFAFEPENNGVDPESAAMLRNYWMQMENSLRQQLLNTKYQQLFGYTLVPNKVEAKNYFTESQTVDTIRYVRITPAAITDAEADLTDADIEKMYQQEKNRFALTEDQNLINYIKVNITPSEADRAQAMAEIDEALTGLREFPGTEGIYNNLKFIVDNHNTSADNLPTAIANRLEQLEADSVMQISFYDNVYTLAKFLGKDKAVDKVKVDVIQLVDNNAATTDSVIGLLASGVSPDSLTTLVAQSMLDQEVSLLDPAMSAVAEMLTNAEVGKYFAPTVEEGFPGNVIYRVASKEAPVDVYEIAEIKYTLEPSNATIGDLRDKLSTFAFNNHTAAQFVDSAAAAGYTVVPAYVGKSSLAVDRVPETRSLAKWGANPDNKGKVSEIVTDAAGTYFMVAAVTDVYDKGFIPASDPFVKNYITPLALAQKKLDIIAERFAGKGDNLDAFAAATNLPIETAAVSFSGQGNNILSADGKLLGIVAATPVGVYVAPTATSNAVVAFEKVSTTAPAREFIETIDMNDFMRHMGHPMFSAANAQSILRHGKEIDNRIQKFSND
ncbi:MAG: SurA N-terminal domain-containing protein [Muribaculaceae bacterium]|nr:SurA N-terminal domain-containing protein [Muribaculaceae bacterium]